jgi:acyl-CoA synthetase (NDP forming)
MPNRSASLHPLFYPQSIAVIGASQDPKKIAGRSLKNLLAYGYQGTVHAVNAKSREVQGRPAVPTLREVQGPVDLAVIVVPASAVPQAMDDCAAKGVKSAIILSSGFAETDSAGKLAQERLTAVAREAGIRVVGPNCMGALNVRDGMFATFSQSFEHGLPQAGGIGIVSQSGAFGAHCLVSARERGLGLSLWATTGNECDVDLGECLEFMAGDVHTNVLLLYMEGCRDKDKLVRGLELAAARRKPVLVLKVGRTELGAQAAASHTASLVGSDAVYDALFEQYGVHRAESLDELMDIAYACTARKFPAAGKVGLVTISGGVGVLMADAATAAGLQVPPMPAETQAKLKQLIPYAAVRNPVDTTAQVLDNMDLIGTNLELMLSEGGCDSVVLFLSTVGMNPVLMEKLSVTLTGVRKKFPDTLAIISSLMRRDLFAPLKAAGFLVTEDPTRAIEMVGALHGFARWFAAQGTLPPVPAIPKHLPAVPDRVLSEHEAKQLLAGAGLPVAAERLAQSAAEAQAAAQALGCPVAMKINSPDIAHKSEVGGVLLGVATPQAAAEGYTALLARVRKAAPHAKLEGVLVAPMVTDGVETILGVKRDPVFGPVVMFGLGGIFVEVMKDVSLRIAPFGVEVARAMIRQIQGFPLLDGARGKPKADVEALAQALSRLSLYAAAQGDRLDSIDINPFIVRPAGQGAVAVDALVVPAAAAGQGR